MAAHIEDLEQQVIRWGSWDKRMINELDRYEGLEEITEESKAGYRDMQRTFRSSKDTYQRARAMKKKAILKVEKTLT